jgi:hypothetical protein
MVSYYAGCPCPRILWPTPASNQKLPLQAENGENEEILVKYEYLRAAGL